jgi:tetratricopeptide (TPR) repeat protein
VTVSRTDDLNALLQLQDGRSLNDISFILIRQHRYKQALHFAQKAYRNTRANPVHAFATFNLGYVLLRLGHCRRAITLLEAALPNEPKDQQPLVRNRIRQAQKTCGRS